MQLTRVMVSIMARGLGRMSDGDSLWGGQFEGVIVYEKWLTKSTSLTLL